jgi:membrane protein
VVATLRKLVRAFQERKLITWATSLSFNALWSLPPLALVMLALAGFFDLRAAWKNHVGPDFKAKLTPETWRAVDSTVNRIVDAPHLAWLAIGLVLAVWHVSGLVRASSGALNSIFDVQEKRPGTERLWKSTLVAFAVIVLVVLAVLIVVGGRLIPWHGAAGVLLFFLRWIAAAVVMWALLAILIRTAPASSPHARWVSAGAGFAIAGWIAASIVFGVYVGYIANFKSPYGNLISVMVLMAYVYWLSLAFLGGVLLDVVLAKRTSG